MRVCVLIAACLVAAASARSYQSQYVPRERRQQQPIPSDLFLQQSRVEQQDLLENTDASNPDDSQQSGDKYLPPTPTTPEPIVRKQFYVISAPDDTADQPKERHLVLGRPQKNYRVIFIKAPPSNNANIRYSAEYAPQEDRTVIYVLSKKDKDLDSSDIATPEPVEASKPEVFFIKYKTPEEAEAAQKEIQNEYDKLGGTNEIADESTAPLASVIGALDGLTPDGAYNYQQINPVPPPAPIAPAPKAKVTRPRSAISQYLTRVFK